MNKAAIRGVVLLVVALTGTACDDRDEKAQAGEITGSVTAGIPLSLTGSLAVGGGLLREGYDHCAGVVNQDGGLEVGGRRMELQLRYEDDQSDPEVASRLVDEWDRQGVELILGPYGSRITGAVAAAVERNGQVMVEGGGSDDAIFARGYRNTFAVIAPASRYLVSMLQAIRQLADPFPATVGIVSADDPFSMTAAEAGADEARRQGMEVVSKAYGADSTTDLFGALTYVREARPDLVLGSVHFEEGIDLFSQSRLVGLRPAGGFGITVAPSVPEFVERLGDDSEGVLSSSQWTPHQRGSDRLFGTAAEYIKGFRARFGREPGYHNASASAACLALVLAIEDAGSVETAGVRAALGRLDTESFFGRITFDETGQNTTRQMAVVQIQDGRVVTVWPPGPGVAKLRWPATGRWPGSAAPLAGTEVVW